MTERDRLALAAWESLFRAQVTLMRGFGDSPAWAGRSAQEYDVLLGLSRGPEAGLRQRDLIEAQLVSQPSLSRMLARLEAEGLIARCPDPRDQRGALLRLTAAGRELQRAIGRAHARDVSDALGARLDEAELAQLRELTTKLLAAPRSGAAPTAKDTP